MARKRNHSSLPRAIAAAGGGAQECPGSEQCVDLAHERRRVLPGIIPHKLPHFKLFHHGAKVQLHCRNVRTLVLADAVEKHGEEVAASDVPPTRALRDEFSGDGGVKWVIRREEGRLWGLAQGHVAEVPVRLDGDAVPRALLAVSPLEG